MKRVIAFTLYGSNPRYTVGAVKNAALAAKIYPEFIVRFYVGSDVPHATITTIGIMPNVELFKVDGYDGQFTNSWRFLAFSDPDVEIAIMRDADARITVRERLAVNEWLQSGLAYHSMKDHPTGHAAWPINAGMWGGYTSGIKNMHEIMQHFRSGKETKSFASDQVFLSRHVAPIVYKNMLIHETFGKTEVSPPSVRKSFPVPYTSISSHIGAAVDENDMFVYDVDKKNSVAVGGNGFFQYDFPVPNVSGAIYVNPQRSKFISSSNFHDFKNSGHIGVDGSQITREQKQAQFSKENRRVR